MTTTEIRIALTAEKINQIRERNGELFAKGITNLSGDELEELGELIDELEKLLHMQRNGF